MKRGAGRGQYQNWGNRGGGGQGNRVTRYGNKPTEFNEPAFVTQPSPVPVVDPKKPAVKIEPEPVTPTKPVQQTLEPKAEVLTPQANAGFATASAGETAAENNNGGDAMDAEGGDENGSKSKKPWLNRRTNDAKLPKKIRKRRQNARLKNLLVPKNAMMLLHELHPDMKMTVLEQSNVNNAYTVEIEIDGEIYRGHGMSKAAAKQAGSENALKAVLLKKIEESKHKTEDVEMIEVNAENGAVVPRKSPPEDDVPWGSLASFALFKLFTDWQAQGFQLPNMGQNAPAQAKANVPFVQLPQKKLPEDAHTKHPVQLLNQLRPGLQYSEDREGMPPNTVFTFRVIIDGRNFTGTGSNKKDAKKHCAKHALEAMGVVYPPE